MKRYKNESAFTLVELLVVISIIALLIAILLPSLQKARNQAKDVKCQTQVKNLALYNTYYASDNGDRLMNIEGVPVSASDPDGPQKGPYNQYEQILNLWSYNKHRELYICPRSTDKPSVTLTTVGQSEYEGDGPRCSVQGYTPNKAKYRVNASSNRFMNMWLKGEFPFLTQSYMQSLGSEWVDELYTEYWFADWDEGATYTMGIHRGELIPNLNGNLINNIPHPDSAVVMADAIFWAPRHDGANMFAFLDTHVEKKQLDQYWDEQCVIGSDPDYDARDRDSFGNHPFWSWGLGRKDSLAIGH